VAVTSVVMIEILSFLFVDLFIVLCGSVTVNLDVNVTNTFAFTCWTVQFSVVPIAPVVFDCQVLDAVLWPVYTVL
jgi:hypothetical protein